MYIFCQTGYTVMLRSWEQPGLFRGGGTFSKNSKKILKKIKNFPNIFQKIFLRKLLKCIILAYFSENLTNHALFFCALGRKDNVLEILRKVSKIMEKLLKKIAKDSLF